MRKIFILFYLFLSTLIFAQDGSELNWKVVTKNAPFPKRGGHTSVVFDNKMWVIGGKDYKIIMNDVWFSADGYSWIQATSKAQFSERYGHTSLVYNSKIWVIGGSTAAGKGLNDIWCSADGVKWIKVVGSAPFRARYGHTSVVFDNKMWVIGGDCDNKLMNDVWCSSDGANWDQVAKKAVFTARSLHASVVFNNKIWVIGGYRTIWHNNPLKDSFSAVLTPYWESDIWSSSDGITWKVENKNAKFYGRAQHTCTVLNDRMWFIGGGNGNEGGTVIPMEDTWYSVDGISWKLTGHLFDSSGHNGRYSHTCLVFDNKLWIIGGETFGRTHSDIWYYPAVSSDPK